MRELKVRAWYKPYKQMCNVSMLQFDYDGTICAAVIIEKPFNDHLRVVKPGCVVAMKWSERDIKTTELLKTLPQKPAFGDKSGMTRWLFFVKGIENA